MVDPRVKRQRNFYTINEFSRTKICFPNSKLSIHHFAQIYAAATPNIIKVTVTGDSCHRMEWYQSKVFWNDQMRHKVQTKRANKMLK